MSSARLRGERASALVGFSLMLPVLVSATALAMFAAHSYEVRSDLQRTAQEAAKYAATRCDPRGASCTNYPSDTQVMTFAGQRFRHVTFQADCRDPRPGGLTATYCHTQSPASATPAPNARLEVTLHYQLTSPFGPLMSWMHASPLVELKATGEAVVE